MARREGADLWADCAEVVRGQISDGVWRTWFDDVHVVEVDSQRVVLAVPSLLAKERIESRYLPLLRDALAEVSGASREIAFEVRTDTGSDLPHAPLPPTPPVPAPPAVAVTGTAAPPTVASPADGPRPEVPLNPRYTFEDFVIGTSNRFACAAALAVAETPGTSYNPLFIYGHAGLGKTHLLHAIGNYVRQNYPGRHVRYVATETFTNEFIDAIRTNTSSAFKRRYRECDILLVDDIQFLEGKEQTLEEFFHTFNTLHEAGRQVVLTSDRPPNSMSTLEVRLRSRFAGGLLTDIQPPDLETRIAILRRKAERDGCDVPGEVLEFIATHVTDNIRELEGALIRVTAYASLNQQALSLGLAHHVLADLLSANQPRQVTPALILDTTAKTFGFTVDELIGKSRRRPLVTARQVGMYVCRELTDFSYPAIAREFGGRDHTTVIHAVEKISTLMKERRVIYDQVTELLHRIRRGG